MSRTFKPTDRFSSRIEVYARNENEPCALNHDFWWVLLQWIACRSVKLITQFHTVPRSTIHGADIHGHHTSSFYVLGHRTAADSSVIKRLITVHCVVMKEAVKFTNVSYLTFATEHWSAVRMDRSFPQTL